MAETSIEWATHSWNPVVGCSLLSPGCTHCYAMAQAARIERMAAGAGKPTHYADLTQASKAGPVWTGRLAAARDHIWWEPVRAVKPREYFVNSMGDLFHEGVPDEWIDRAFAMMALAPQHTFIVLTKRTERMRRYMTGAVVRPPYWGADYKVTFDDGLARYLGSWLVDMLIKGGCPDGKRLLRDDNWPLDDDAPDFEPRLRQWPLPNVVLGVSVEDQARADERVPHLLATPAATRIISAEPLLGPVDLTEIEVNGEAVMNALWPSTWQYLWDECWSPEATKLPHEECVEAFLDWHGLSAMPSDMSAVAHPLIDAVIVGGESGRDARPMHPDWARSLRDQCATAGAGFFFKQWGSWRPSFESRGDGPQMLTRWVYPQTGGECGGALMAHLPRSKAGRLLDGHTHDALPWRNQEA